MSNGERGGPYLIAALLCEKVLQETSGTLSAIRIVDRITVTAQGSSAPEAMPVLPVHLTALLIFKPGAARGNYTVKIEPELPSGMRAGHLSMPILLEGEDRSVNLILELNFQAREEGVYWFDIMLSDDLVTRIPLRVVYQRVTMSQTGGTPIH